MILASSPPSSITTSVWGIRASTADLQAITSWMKSTSKIFAISNAPDPVSDSVNVESL